MDMLNKNKCELMSTEKDPNIHFTDHTKVTKKDEVKYLGCQLNQKGDISKEIGKRIANAWNTLQNLQIFWRKSNCPITFKIIAIDAIVRSKLIYGIDSMQLNEPDQKRMEKFHLQALRKILNWDTTFIDRDKTNAKIYQEVNEKISNTMKEYNKTRKEQKKPKKRIKPVITFAEFYKTMKLKRIEKAINSTEEIHHMTFNETLTPRIPPARKPGRPKYKWAEKGIKEYWDKIRNGWKDQYSDQNKWKQDWKEYDSNNETQKAFIVQYAPAAILVPEDEWSKYPNKETKWIEGVNYTREKSEKEKRKEEYEANKERRRTLGLLRQAEAQTQNRDHIAIPTPSYSYGAVRRSRFAFGRITSSQARRNTALQFRTEPVTTPIEPEVQAEDMLEQFPDIVEEEEQSEEDLFQFDENPNQEDCA